MENAHEQKSMLMWYLESVGIYGILILASAALVFVLTLLLLIKGKGPASVAGILLLAPLPFMIGCFAAIKGAIASFAVMALADVALKPSEWAGGTAECLVLLFTGIFLSIPNYWLAVGGLIYRSFKPKE